MSEPRILCDISLNKSFVLKELIFDTGYTPEYAVINLYTGDNDFSVGCNWDAIKTGCDGKWAVWIIKYDWSIKSLKTEAVGYRQIAWEHVFHKKVSDKWKLDYKTSMDIFKDELIAKIDERGVPLDVLACGYCHIAKIDK